MKRLLFILLLLPLFTDAQIITTIAGDGIAHHTGDGGPATAAGLLHPRGIAVDRSGNLFITEGKWVRKINSSGIITTVVGLGTSYCPYNGEPATSAPLSQPIGIAVDDLGNYYITDENIVLKVNNANNIYKVAGLATSSGGYSGYTGDGGPATAARLYAPSAIVIDGSGNIYIADEANQVVRKVDASGIITTVAGNGYGAGCCPGGFSGDGGPATAAELYDPEGVAVDKAGNLFISDKINYRIRKVNTSGIITTLVSGIGEPCGIRFDSSGSLYVNDYSADLIYKITTSDTLYIIAGNYEAGHTGDGGPATTASLNGPTGIAIDTVGNIYIADQLNNCIRKITSYPRNVKQIVSRTKNITLSPNPATTTLTISAHDTITTISITNFLGQTKYTHEYNTSQVQVDVANLPKGIYFVRINGSVVRKFVKE